MSLPVVLTEEAETELDEAAQWYEQQAGLGTDFVAAVRAILSHIGTMPEARTVVYRDVRRAVVRRFPYSVFYRPLSDRVEVLAVFYNRRDPAIWQKRV